MKDYKNYLVRISDVGFRKGKILNFVLNKGNYYISEIRNPKSEIVVSLCTVLKPNRPLIQSESFVQLSSENEKKGAKASESFTKQLYEFYRNFK